MKARSVTSEHSYHSRFRDLQNPKPSTHLRTASRVRDVYVKHAGRVRAKCDTCKRVPTQWPWSKERGAPRSTFQHFEVPRRVLAFFFLLPTLPKTADGFQRKAQAFMT